MRVAGIAICVAYFTLALVAGVWRPANRSHLWLALALGGPATMLLFALAGYVIAGRALAPVKEMVERTRRLSAKSLNERLPVANPHDELGQLATVFNETLQQLENSFAELKRFTADVSHELRTPLTAIRAVGEVAYRERNPAILYDALGSILEEVQRMNQLIDRLLLLARADDDNLPVHLEAGLVRDALGRSQRRIGAGGRRKAAADGVGLPGPSPGGVRPGAAAAGLAEPHPECHSLQSAGQTDHAAGFSEGRRSGHRSRRPGPRHRSRAPPEDFRAVLPRGQGPLARRGRGRFGAGDCEMVRRTDGRGRWSFRASQARAAPSV